MMRRVCIFLLTLFSAGISMLAGNGMVLYNSNVVDIENGQVLYNHTVKIKNGKIKSIEPARERMCKGEYDMTGKIVYTREMTD